MTVAELIAELQKIEDQGLEVWMPVDVGEGYQRPKILVGTFDVFIEGKEEFNGEL